MQQVPFFNTSFPRRFVGFLFDGRLKVCSGNQMSPVLAVGHEHVDVPIAHSGTEGQMRYLNVKGPGLRVVNDISTH